MGFPCWQLTAWGLPRSFVLPHFTGRQSAELRVTDCAPDSNLGAGTPSQLNPSNMYEPRTPSMQGPGSLHRFWHKEALAAHKDASLRVNL